MAGLGEVAQARPPAALRGLVGSFSGVRTATAATVRRRELPVPGTAVILALDHDWWIGAHEDAALVRHGSFAGGLTLGPALSEHRGPVDSVQLDLTPEGTRRLLGVPAAALAGEVIALEDLLGREVTLLAERMAGLGSWEARFAALGAWAAHRASRAEDGLPPDVAWAWQRIVATGGRVAIGTLQAELGCSRRHLSARFAEHVGTPPKAFARVVRFDAAARRLRSGEGDLARVAAEGGFADQSHLAREVRSFAGTTPSALVADAWPAEVTDVQDAWTPAA